MSGDKVSSPCSHFQANIFNKSKCQNCFKSRELHPPSDRDLEQVKPIYAGWLCLAPEGTDFDNPVHRSRKWQRRFFILYEDGGLSFALDELPSTLPQGTINMNKCTDIVDAEPRTGQRNAVWIITSEQEIFIRGDNKDIINGWGEQLALCLQSNKQNAKNKRKVEPSAPQEPSPAKMAAPDPSLQSSSSDSSKSKQWQGEDGAPHTNTTVTHASPESARTDDVSSCLRVASIDPLSPDSSIQEPAGRARHAMDRSCGSSAERLQGSEVTPSEQEVELPGCRQGRSEARTNTREKLSSCGDISQLHPPAAPQRRAKSLDRRTSDSIITPDLLNFKKGWMVKLDEKDQWKKFWFVLSTDSLRYYRDSMAEEASELEGEIDLTTCFSVSEYQVQRNYGFQIHTSKGVFTLSAMTAGIRKNWIQALMKNVLPANAPDVASLPAHHISCNPPEVLPKPDVTQDSPPAIDLGGLQPRPRSASEKRQGDFHRISDLAELRPCSEPSSPARSPCSLELMDIERRKRREERRKRYESILGFSLGWEEVGGKIGDGGVRALSPKSKRMREVELEECWRKVEQMMFRPERMILLFTKSRDVLEMEMLLQSYRQAMEELSGRLAESERCRLKLEAPLDTAELHQQMDAPLVSDFFLSDGKKLSSNGEHESLRRGKDLMELEPLQPSPPPPPTIWLQDTNGSLHELEDLLSDTNTSPLLSPAASDSHDDPSEDDRLHRDNTLDLEDLLDEEDIPLFSSSGTKVSKGDFSSLILETLPDLEKDSPSNCIPADEEVVMKLSQEVEQLTSQNKALNQRNQEMLNQLTEADREIERLKAELSSRYSEPRHLPEAEQEEKVRLEDLQQELSQSNQQLLEAQTLITSLEDNLREMEATEAKLTELERRLCQSEQTREELQHDKAKLTEKEKLHHQRAAELEAEVQKVTEKLENERLKEKERRRESTAEAKTQQVMEHAMTRLHALLRLLEIMDGLDWDQECGGEGESSAAVTQLKQEEKIWTLMLNKLKEESSTLRAPTDELLIEATQQMILENQLLLRGHALLHEGSEGSDHSIEDPWSCDSASQNKRNQLKLITQRKILFLHRVTSSMCDSDVQQMSDMRFDIHSSQHSQSVSSICSAATEALLCSRSEDMESQHIRRSCSTCERLTEEHRELRATLTNLLQQQQPSSNACCQTEETFPQDADDQSDTQEMETEVQKVSEEPEDSDPKQLILALNIQVEELKAELSNITEEFEVKFSNVRLEKEKEVEKMKAACDHGFTCMEESHMKLVEELQHRHQLELQRLLLERDRLLEEESAATATAIEAIQNAHQLELQREVHRRSLSENSSGDVLLEEILRQHSEELASHQRELQVLSQQFTLKCLENGHLIQAVDAERKALCQCQQENQDLRTRNQELSGHLAAEITRLCSLAKQDAPPLSQRMDVYEMEIMLRVKESEVQCLKQEIVSLKDELQSALKDKRNATKKYKDMYTELSIVRAKAERDADELRENLQLAHLALGQTTP